jgi:nicotinate phosphoribosyltransferase
MAHSFILAEGDEVAAFDAFVSRYPGTTLLVDTFDTATGANNAIKIAKKHGPGSVAAIRLDSGDLRAEAWQARIKLDTTGLSGIRIVASGGLDEYQIAELVEANAPIDVFACGTSIVAPPDAATLDSAYKIVEYDGRPVAKRSPGKPSIGHRKQVWRADDHDLVGRFDEPPSADADALLGPMMESGQRTAHARDTLEQIRRRAGAARGPRRVLIDPSLID